ncbi:signal transduction histidine kinase [Fontibacillus phaseoli]|uniref:histidine kinase n=1 Tax=Fontibacillus phaseoli TaxID=1416533 RepID=A0A369AXL8_9BACL|nr:ATP-binding protein [Fontibacillus phaseoli]RCX14029.1 signal transduction histidine kinase [Fontibacillus phaseoli]
MRMKRLLSLRVKFLLYVIGSFVSTVSVLYVCWQLAAYVLKLPNSPFVAPFRSIIRAVINHIGSVPAIIVVGMVMFVTIYFLLARGTTRYLKEIDQALVEVGLGHLDVKIPVRTSDELGKIAESLNTTMRGLNSSLQEIINGLEEIARGRFDREIAVQTGELAKVSESINSMAVQLSRSIEEERLAERSKNDLITGVSHDLRTPLTSILGFLKAIEEDRYKDETELRYYVNIAYEKSLDLKKLIDELFEYTRIHNGLPIQKSELDLVGFLRQLAEEFVPALEQAGMVSRVTALQEEVLIPADGNLLVRVFENLMVNAIQYGAEGKFIDIQVGTINGWARVAFINYGEEIPLSSLPHLFDRFYRIEGSRSKSTGGTGLGLAISKSIVDVHGGLISVESNRQQTVFETRFPLA